MRLRFLNGFKTTLGAAITSNSQNNVTLAAGQGAALKTALLADSAYAGSGAALPSSDGLILALDDGAGSVEFVLLTGPWDNAGTADVLGGAGGGTLTRGYDGSTAFSSLASGKTVACYDSRAAFNAFSQSAVKRTFADGMIELAGAGALDILSASPASAPTATDAYMALFGRSIGSHPKVGRPAILLPGETDVWMPGDSELIYRHARMAWRGNGFDNYGMQVLSSVSAVTTTLAPALAPTSRRGLITAARVTTAATARNCVGFWPYNPGGGNSCGYPLVRSTVAGQGAWWTRHLVGFTSAAPPIATSRILIGVQSQFNTTSGTRPVTAGTSSTDSDPSQNASDLVGLCADATLTNFSLITRDNSAGGTAATTYAFAGAATRGKTTAGAGGIQDKLYELLLVNGPGNGAAAGALYARVLEWDASSALWTPTVLFDGQLNGALMPRTDTFLFPVAYHDNGNTATSVGVEVPFVYFSSSAR